ncbi:DNA polymerase III subunit alpha [Alkalibacillus aidingensis]|uniref:DNA polymerase III subunit alpha n=1 Tax=Alkalibacillus aidingensis TaxID=2747607 RepID=UPI0016602072|nr:DNA polymerase III subunit alpha [Alkalibacillus aidingensis]
MNFVHLQIHSSYTLMNSTIDLEQLVQSAANLGFESIALTDHEVLHGVYTFTRLCEQYQINPIVGMTCDVQLPEEKRPIRMILLAKDEVGYQSLVRLSNKKNIEKHPIMLEDIAEARQLVPIISFYHTFMEELIYLEEHDYLMQLMDRIHSSLPYWLINVQPSRNQDQVQAWLHREGSEFRDQAVITDDVRYLKEEDRIGYEALRAMQDGLHISELSLKELPGTHLKTLDDYGETILDQWNEAFQRTIEVAARCHFSMSAKWFTLPQYPSQDGLTSKELLEKLCVQQLKLKYHDQNIKQARQRLNHELSVINQMDFADYFLIVWDLVRYAKRSNILTGPGRGSAAGSIVAYLLDITEVDPIEHQLLFERFLNPERQTMPDIDIDFSDYRRDEVIQYVKERYGSDRVSQIITFGTFQAKSTIRELSKVFKINRETLTFLLKELSQHQSSIRRAISENSKLKKYIKQSDQLIKMFQAALVIEGTPRHYSVHAAGVIISNQTLLEKVPMFNGTEGVLLTQLPMNDLEALGLLKMDFLGLRNLTLLERMIQQIKEREGYSIKLDQIPKNDPETFKLLQRGWTTGVFQLESDGMKGALRVIRPTSFEDIVAVNALYRPGPMQFIETFANRKHNKESINYIHPDLKPILEETYGVLVYQEQIMQIVHHLAKFSLGQADLLRRAISKKDAHAIQEMKQSFIDGCLKHGYKYEVAIKIFDWIERFADYGFNKSHAVAYSMISYQIAYFKANYPSYFYAELLSSVMHDASKLEQYINEARQVGINVLLPSINHSFGKFTVEGPKSVRFGLLAIKGLGKQAVDEIIRARSNKGFKNLFDFCQRISLKVINRTLLESLIIVGAFDETHSNRAQLLASTVQAMDQGELFSDIDEQSNWDSDLFEVKVEYTEVEPFPILKELNMEKEVMGFRISQHPLSTVRRALMQKGLLTINEWLKRHANYGGTIAASISRLKPIRTKRGEQMAFATLQDETGEVDAVIFPKVFREVGRWLSEDQMVQIEGRLDEREGKWQVIINQIKEIELDELPKNSEHQIFIRLESSDEKAQLQKLKEIHHQFPGTTPIAVYSLNYRKLYQLSPKFDLDLNEKVITILKSEFKPENVVIQEGK